MSNKITENTIEEFAIELLERLGYQYIYAPDIAHDLPAGKAGGERPERNSYEDVLLTERLQNAIRRINPKVPIDSQEEALKEIQRINSPELLANNEQFHRMLTEGINVSYQKDLPASVGQAGGREDRGDLVWLIDFENPENNEFIVANQFTVIENGNNKRPDVILFVNGIPLVVIELKNPADENATIKSAFKQLQTYKEIIPSLFTYNGLMIISDGLEAKAGSLSAGLTRFMAWKSADGKEEASNVVSQLETLINGMLNKETLLDLIRHFVVFEKSKKEDSKTGIVSISTVKRLAAYHQYYAVNRAVESALRATGFNSPPQEGWSKTGVVKRNAKNYFSLPYNPKLKERARELRKAGNLPEVLFWQRVHKKKFKGYDFDRQKIIGNYIVDFFCTNSNVVIEIDGNSHDNKKEYDAKRDAYLESLHLKVIHITAKDVLQNLNGVMEMLLPCAPYSL